MVFSNFQNYPFMKDKKTDVNNLTFKDYDYMSLNVGAPMLSRYGEAGRQIYIGLTGRDNVAGIEMKKSLISIFGSKINPEWRIINISQQAGFSSEVLDTAKRNANAVKKGETVRYSRIDDLPGHAINETAYDVMAIDMATGQEIAGSAAQMKFMNSSPKELANTLTSEIFCKKYPHGTFMIPKDDYPKVTEELVVKEQNLPQEIVKLKQTGNTDRIQQKTAELEQIQRVRNNLRQSTVSRKEAIFAREHPQLTAAKEMLKLGHEAGCRYAMIEGGIACGFSAVDNIGKLSKGDISPKEALANIAKDTAKGLLRGYVIGQINTLFTAVMTNSPNREIQHLGKKNAPASMISSALNAFSILEKTLRL